MDIERIKEDLSICYLKTIAAINGIALEQFNHDEDSTDVVIKKVIEMPGGLLFNSQVSVQLKSTSSLSQYTINDKEITYKLKVKNYNDLCSNAAMPSILGLFILPKDKNEWVNWNENDLLLKGQLFWIGLQGKAKSTNSGTVSVKIPLTNRLSKETIEDMLVKAAEEGRL